MMRLTSRLTALAQRMNPAIFASLPASACALGAQGGQARTTSDPIGTKNVYDAVGQLLKVQEAFGTTHFRKIMRRTHL